MRVRLFIAALLIASANVASPVFAIGGQVACPTVLREYNKVRKSEDKVIPAIEKVAKKYKTSPLWVENCMRAYGRNVPTHQLGIDHDVREDLLERMEEAELGPEDLAAEDLSEPDPPTDPDSPGTRKRPPLEHIRRQQYLPVAPQ